MWWKILNYQVLPEGIKVKVIGEPTFWGEWWQGEEIGIVEKVYDDCWREYLVVFSDESFAWFAPDRLMYYSKEK